MLILVEGADASGKSTFISHLVDALLMADPHASVDVRHCGPPTAHPLVEYEDPLLAYRPGTDTHIIYDRHFVGEWVYPQVFNRPSRADRAVLTHIQLFLRSRGAIIAHVNPGDEIIGQRLQARGDFLVTREQAMQAARRFRLLFSNRIFVPTIDVSTDQEHRTPFNVALVTSTARACEAKARVLNEFTTYVGPTHPRYLLLGDVRHHRKDDLTSPEALSDLSPALGPFSSTSGHFLLNHLPTHILPYLGIANACDVDDPRALWSALGQPTTVTLGANAHKAAPWAAANVPHPQYVRRFAHASGLQYGQDIAATLERSELM